MMKIEIYVPLMLTMAFMFLNVWALHGLDMQFYTIQNARMFDINLFIAVLSSLMMGLMASIQLRFIEGKK